MLDNKEHDLFSVFPQQAKPHYNDHFLQMKSYALAFAVHIRIVRVCIYKKFIKAHSST